MICLKKLKKFFQKNEAARPPPMTKKRNLVESAIIPLGERINMNHPVKHQKQNFKTPPHFFESTRGPPKY